MSLRAVAYSSGFGIDFNRKRWSGEKGDAKEEKIGGQKRAVENPVGRLKGTE